MYMVLFWRLQQIVAAICVAMPANGGNLNQSNKSSWNKTWKNNMGMEIERKFLVDLKKFSKMIPYDFDEDNVPEDPSPLGDIAEDVIRQSYITDSKYPFTMRVRKTTYASLNPPVGHPTGVKYSMTIKNHRTKMSSIETNIDISEGQYNELKLLRNVMTEEIIKIRYTFKASETLKWEVDIFDMSDRLRGLAIAEIELPSEDTLIPELPDWIIREVTGQKAYSNESLANKSMVFRDGHVFATTVAVPSDYSPLEQAVINGKAPVGNVGYAPQINSDPSLLQRLRNAVKKVI